MLKLISITSIVLICIEAAGIKKINMPHGRTLPIDFVPNTKDMGKSPEEFRDMKVVYSIDHTCLIYIVLLYNTSY
jgi:hypothetical protein